MLPIATARRDMALSYHMSIPFDALSYAHIPNLQHIPSTIGNQYYDRTDKKSIRCCDK